MLQAIQGQRSARAVASYHLPCNRGDAPSSTVKACCTVQHRSHHIDSCVRSFTLSPFRSMSHVV